MIEWERTNLFERMSPRELQVEFEGLLSNLSSMQRDNTSNLKEINYLTRLLEHSRGTMSFTSYILKSTAKLTPLSSTHPFEALNRYDPANIPGFPETLFDEEGEGVFGIEIMRMEANALRGYIYSGEQHGIIVTKWKGEFHNHYGVTYETAIAA